MRDQPVPQKHPAVLEQVQTLLEREEKLAVQLVIEQVRSVRRGAGEPSDVRDHTNIRNSDA